MDCLASWLDSLMLQLGIITKTDLCHKPMCRECPYYHVPRSEADGGIA